MWNTKTSPDLHIPNNFIQILLLQCGYICKIRAQNTLDVSKFDVQETMAFGPFPYIFFSVRRVCCLIQFSHQFDTQLLNIDLTMPKGWSLPGTLKTSPQKIRYETRLMSQLWSLRRHVKNKRTTSSQCDSQMLWGKPQVKTQRLCCTTLLL